MQPWDGYVAQYLGDGLMVYFGWPTVREDAAVRAVHASLALLAALGPLNDTQLAPRYGVRGQVRLGMHTGMAVIGEMGGGDRYEQLAMGETPNIAARLQGLAAPDTMVLSAVTARLVQRRFALEPLGTHPLKGVTEPMPVFRVLGVPDTADDEEADTPGSAVFRVGRDEGLGLLRRRWEQSKEGLGQVVLIRGEAGIGKSSLVETLRALAGVEDALLQDRLAPLVDTELLYQRERPPRAKYIFKHVMVQDAAYASLLKSTRQQYHQQVAQMLEARFPDTVATEPELLAQHYTEAGLIAEAVPYWQRAGQRAIERSANVEAMAHLRQGIALLTTLPDTPARLQAELAFQTTLGPALMATRGYAAPEVAATYRRARELCQQVGDTPDLFPVLWSLFVLYLGRVEHETAWEFGEQCLSLARRLDAPALLLEAHLALGASGFYLGQLSQAHAHLAQGMRLYNPQQHHALAFRYGNMDPGVAYLAYAGLTLWMLGYPDQALERVNAALTLAQNLEQPFILARVLYWTTLLHQWRREWQVVCERTETAITVATAQQMALVLTPGPIMRGWALAMQGQGAEGLTQLYQGLDAYRATGAAFQRPHFLSMLAEVHRSLGQPEAGLTALREALALVETTGERYYEAELHRLQGELLLQHAAPEVSHAEACFQQSLAIARRQQAKSLELRAAMSLGRLWQRQGKRDEARALLAPIYGWFTEGFDTADVQEAKALLDELSGALSQP
jgi:predicted ATPase